MTTELPVLALLGILAASLWVRYNIGVNMHKVPVGAPDPFLRPGSLNDLPAWLHRAHLNMLEQFLSFAVLVLPIDRVDGYGALTYWTAIAFLCVRPAQAVGMISATASMPLRPFLYTLGWVCCLLMACAVLAAGT